MKLFIDSGNLHEIESLVPLGIIDGITTNPSLLAKEGGDARAIVKRICEVVKGPVSAEVVATESGAMITEGRELAKIDDHVVVKIPFTREGIKAIKALSGEGIRINTTLIFSATQALFAAKAGSTTSRLTACCSSSRSSRSSITTSSGPKCSSRVSARPCTSSRPRVWGPTSAPVPRR
jgi:transaldolase